MSRPGTETGSFARLAMEAAGGTARNPQYGGKKVCFMAELRHDLVRLMLVDEIVMRRGIISALANEDDIAVVAEACNGEETLLHSAMAQPMVVVIDPLLPELGE